MALVNINDKWLVILKEDDNNEEVKSVKVDDSLILASGVFSLNYIPSVNSLYMFSDGCKIMDPEMKKQRYDVFNQLARAGHTKNAIPANCKLTLEIGYYLVSEINKRDLDNFSKWTIDTIAEFFCFNDSRVYNFSCYKRLLVNSEKELIYFRIKQIKFNTIDNNSINFNYLN